MSVNHDFRIIKLDSNTVIKPFCCSDADLNGFLADDALKYTTELVTVTYIWETKEKTIAYYSLLNDTISVKGIESRWKNRFNRQMPNPKRRDSYPAVKIGRLAVSEEFEKQGFGTQILDFVKSIFTTNNRTGCRFLTVDAYDKPEVLAFYKKNGFDFLTDEDEGENTRLMYYDLKNFVTHDF